MKIIFLDIDGVLNSDKFYAEHSKIMQESGYPDNYPYTEFDYRAVNRLNRIVSETGCNIVLSSSWRTDDNVRDILNKIGINIYDKTPYLGNVLRGQEIQRWIDEHPDIVIEDYIILDDVESFLKKQKKRIVRTQTYFGLTDDIAEKIIRRFNRSELPVLKVIPCESALIKLEKVVPPANSSSYIYMHGKLWNSFPTNDQVYILNKSDFQTYVNVVDFLSENFQETHIDYEGVLDCNVVGYKNSCKAFLWKVSLDDCKKITKGLIVDAEDIESLEYARDAMENKNLVI